MRDRRFRSFRKGPQPLTYNQILQRRAKFWTSDGPLASNPCRWESYFPADRVAHLRRVDTPARVRYAFQFAHRVISLRAAARASGHRPE